MKRLFTILTAVGFPIIMSAQGYETLEENTVEFSAKSKLSVFNINGPVTIIGSDRESIELSYVLKARPKNAGGLTEAKRDLDFTVEEFSDSLTVRLDGPFTRYFKGRRHFNMNSDLLDYWFNCEIILKTPLAVSVKAATINDGSVQIRHIRGNVIAENVNGDVAVEKIEGRVIAETINGDIDVDFPGNPRDGSKFHSINGNINTKVPHDLSADVSFKSMNGEFYTDFSYNSTLGGRLTKSDDGSGSKYKIEQFTRVTIGDGQSRLHYETLNGNMYLRKHE